MAISLRLATRMLLIFFIVGEGKRGWTKNTRCGAAMGLQQHPTAYAKTVPQPPTGW
jgi:hypothetical protein